MEPIGITVRGEGEWVLVWGVGSGVGSAALVIAKALGARVVATSADDATLERAGELGADVAVREDAALRASCRARGVDHGGR